ncbi:hypothetical protein C8R43DRAFT_965910 [Mycena crocata]|nr:hypothetical protein C8R43DRAFT_965910 [Mycena crocata]
MSSPAPQIPQLFCASGPLPSLNFILTAQLGFAFVAMPILLIPIVLPGMAVMAGIPAQSPSSAAAPAPATVATPAPVPAPAPVPQVTPPAPKAAPGTGLPAPLIAMLQSEAPFVANGVYRVTPTEPLVAIDEPIPAPEWYAITRGRFVGVVDQYALSAIAISGVAHAVRKSYTTQNLVIDAFNAALRWGGVQVV